MTIAPPQDVAQVRDIVCRDASGERFFNCQP